MREVVALGQLSGDIRASSHVQSVRAGTISDLSIAAGYTGYRGEVVSVIAGSGGIRTSDIRGTSHVRSVTAGAAGIQTTEIRAEIGRASCRERV